MTLSHHCNFCNNLVIDILKTEKKRLGNGKPVTRERRNETGFRENTLLKVYWKKYFGKSILNFRK